MTHEVGLYAGIAVVAMIRDACRPDFRSTGRSPRVLQLIQAAISKLSHHLRDGSNDAERSQIEAASRDAAIVAAMFLAHIAVSISESLLMRHIYLFRELQ